MIIKAVDERTWKPIRISRGGPPLSHILFADDILLMAEASVAQVRVVKECLDRFCRSSGQKINPLKSKIFISPNVETDLAQRIQWESGFSVTSDLGVYLGMPLLHKKIDKHTFDPLLQKINNKLSGWRSKNLSLAGRITLAKSVITSLPVYTMASIDLPGSVCDKIDQITRSFVWGS
ncbi:uncharacterized protein A4U43_C05F7270 [Asparagus officinalis]|uniref:Reverse transcriptase domain-containing protein n=1 Tax=Asparagus officinalis TaxID=4686 RepID=A0A5P1EPZ0_ASPOF|nr:uncharacterized protein A4U43_C05F7270 [Asparagus officinalis]